MPDYCITQDAKKRKLTEKNKQIKWLRKELYKLRKRVKELEEFQNTQLNTNSLKSNNIK